MPPPPKPLLLKDVPAYLLAEHQIEVTRQTVYNWRKSGRQGEHLDCWFGVEWYTTIGRLEDFLSRIKV
jgi:hypothetical protein